MERCFLPLSFFPGWGYNELMSDSFSAIIEFLESREYRFTSTPDEERVNLTLAGKHADYRVTMRVTHGGDFFQIYIHYPFRVREMERRSSVAELICRANYGMLVGGFEIDMEDGEIRFHVAHLIQGLPLAADVVERLLFTAISSLDRYFPAFMQHLHAGLTPGDAVYMSEIDIHASTVTEQTPSPAATSHRSADRPPSDSARKGTRVRKSRRKGGGKEKGDSSQGDLPI